MKKSRKKRKQLAQKQFFDHTHETQYRQQAQKLLAAGKFQKAKEQIDHIRKCNPEANIHQEMSQFLHQRAEWKLNREDVSGALEDFLRLHKTYGGTDSSFYFIAKCHLLLNQEAEAESFLQQAFDEQCLPAQQTGLLLKILLLQEKISQAQTIIQEQTSRFTQTDLEWTKGILALKQKQYREATTCFENAQTTAQDAQLSLPFTAWQAYSLILEQKPKEAWAKIKMLPPTSLKGWLIETSCREC